MSEQTLNEIFEQIGSGDPEPENNAEATLEDGSNTQDLTPEPEDAADNAQSATGEDDPVRVTLEELRKQYPGDAVDQIHKRLDAEFKRGMTPKLQKAAELEQRMAAYEDISPEEAQAFRALKSATPQQAAVALQAEVDRLNAMTAQANPYQEMEYLTNNERVMAQQLQAQQQQLATLNEANARIEMTRQFEALEKQYGSIPFEERDAVSKRVKEIGGQPEIAPMVWSHMFLPKILQRERDKTSQTVAKKAGMSPAPSGVSNRASSAPPAVENLSKDQLWDVLASQGGSD